jgi:HlyD family secretion protein
MLNRLLLVGTIAALLLGGLLYSQMRRELLKVSGFIESDEIRVGSRVGGRVKRILIEEGDRVEAGKPLIELEPYILFEQKQQAVAQLAQATADYDRLKAGYQPEEVAAAKARRDQLAAARDKLADGEEDIAAAKSQLELAQSELQLATQKYTRIEGLFGKNSASQSDLDQATTELRVARAKVQVREEELAKVQRLRPTELKEAAALLEQAEQEYLLRKHGYREEDKARAKATVDVAQAALAAIDAQIDELTIRAPADGVIEAVDLRPGDLVGANTPAVSIAESGRLWVRAFVPENHLNIAVGRKLQLAVDSFPERRFQGTVTFISRQAEFTPGNVQTPEERSKQVFRIKVTLDEGHDVLRAGMSADVWLEPEHGGS